MRELTVGMYHLLSCEAKERVAVWLRRHGVELTDCYRYAEIEPGRFAIYTYERTADGHPRFIDGEPARKQTLVIDEWLPPFWTP